MDDEAANYYAYQNGGSYNNGNPYYVGPYCADNGKSVVLSVFSDGACSVPAPEGTYEALHYGAALPYADGSLVSDDCVACGGNDDEDAWGGVTDFCRSVYRDVRGKCETDLEAEGVYPDDLACDFIDSPKSPGILSSIASVTPKVLAVVFALSTMAFGYAAYHFWKKSNRP